MSKSTFNITFLIILAAFMFVACSKNDDTEVSSNVAELGYFTPTDKDTNYCLSCHKSYEELAVQTSFRIDPNTGISEARGDKWGNPHNSFHGGPVPCMSCHGDAWMPSASEKGKCNDALNKAKLSQSCWSCHEPQELYLEKDQHNGWDYTK